MPFIQIVEMTNPFNTKRYISSLKNVFVSIILFIKYEMSININNIRTTVYRNEMN